MKHRLLAWHREPGLWWFRVYGRGISAKNIQTHPPSFSERNGYGRGWLVRRLK